jgi:hypothetical protein
MTRPLARLNRRDFLLRLRATEHGCTLELSCHALFMRCLDCASERLAASVDDESARGEPPACLERRTLDEVHGLLERELAGAQVLRLIEPQWLKGIAGAENLEQIVDAFKRRGGRLETQDE